MFQMTVILELIISHEEQALCKTHHELVVFILCAGIKGTLCYVAQLNAEV
jgi:hypothetical protein